MTISFIIFIVAVLLIGVFFLVKQRELSRGSKGPLSRVLSKYSPALEARFSAVSADAGREVNAVGTFARDAGIHGLAVLRKTLRGFIVLLAAKMVRLVKGEKLLYSQAVPSLYLKRLKGEMEKGETEGGTLEETK